MGMLLKKYMLIVDNSTPRSIWAHWMAILVTLICQCYWHLHAMVKIQAFPRQGQNKGYKPQELCEGGSILMYYPNTVLCQGFSAKCKAKGFTSFNSCGRSHMLTGPRTSHDWPVKTPDLKLQLKFDFFQNCYLKKNSGYSHAKSAGIFYFPQ